MDVVAAPWRAAGAPTLPLPVSTQGPCARGGQRQQLGAMCRVVSDSFTGYDEWFEPNGFGLCPACVWGYRCRRLREIAHLVTARSVSERTLPQVGRLLNEPVAAGVALVVPLRAGRQHLLPRAKWGTVTTEHGCLPWSAIDSYRLGVLRRLRAAGFGSRMFVEDVPPWSVLRRMTPARPQEVLSDWSVLDPWQASPAWLELAVLVTVPGAVGEKAAVA